MDTTTLLKLTIKDLRERHKEGEHDLFLCKLPTVEKKFKILRRFMYTYLVYPNEPIWPGCEFNERLRFLQALIKRQKTFLFKKTLRDYGGRFKLDYTMFDEWDSEQADRYEGTMD